jgi:hypothetical protein
MRYAHYRYEPLNVSLKLTSVHVMNAEYISHERVWQMLKPKVYVGLEGSESETWTGAPVLAPVPAFLDWYPTALSLVALAHGHRELSSPLSEW